MHSKPQHVVMLCPDLHEVGGIGAVSRMAYAALQSQGCGGEVWSLGAPPHNGSTLHSPSWQVRYASGQKALPAMWGLKAGLHSGKDTFVVAMHLHLAPVALPLVERRARMAVFLHGIEAWTALAGFRASALKQADVLIANSQFTARQFLAANPDIGDKPMKICPLGVAECGTNGGHETGTNPFALIVGRLSSLERYKGHDALLGIWHRVVHFHPGTRLLVAGDGDDRARLEAKAKELGLADSVKFLGRVDGSALNALYRDCVFFVMPSAREGFGLTFLEAMRAGKPCIGAQGAAEEIIEDGATGLIVPPENQMALLDAVSRLFTDPLLRERMGKAGEERFRSQFTELHFQDRFLTALGFNASR